MMLLRIGCKGRDNLRVAAAGICCYVVEILGRNFYCAVSITATVSIG